MDTLKQKKLEEMTKTEQDGMTPHVCVCVCVRASVCVCMYGHRNTLPSSPLSVLDLSTFSCFFNSFSRLLTVCLFSPVSLSVSNTHAGTLKAGNTDVTVFPVCSELLPT